MHYNQERVLTTFEDLDGAITDKLGLEKKTKPNSLQDRLIDEIASQKFHGKASAVDLQQTRQMLQGTPPAVLNEMLNDMKHPSIFERAEESSIMSTVTTKNHPKEMAAKAERSSPVPKRRFQTSSDRSGAKSKAALNSVAPTHSSSRLPGVKESSWAGVAAAVKAGTHGAARMPGVKEATWPFAPGSFSSHRVPGIPGVNENSWWVFEPGSSWRADRARAAAEAGGCRPGPHGKLLCEGDAGAQSALEAAIDRATGLADVRSRATLLHDAKKQGLEGAAAVFGATMRAQSSSTALRSGRVQMLPPQSLQPARTQSLEIVGTQCSTLLDCFRIQSGRLVPHRTRPSVAAEWDRDVRRPEDSANLWAIASGAARRASEVASSWDRRSALSAPGYTGRIGRPSARSPTGEARDVGAAGWPTSRDATAMRTMYARRPARFWGAGRALEAPGRTAMLSSDVPFFDDDLKAKSPRPCLAPAGRSSLACL